MATVNRIDNVYKKYGAVRRGPKTDAYKGHRIIFRLTDAQYNALVKLANIVDEKKPNPNLAARAVLCDVLDRYIT